MEELRENMIALLVERGSARSPEVIEALRAVPRHLVGGVDVGDMYDPFKAAVTKRDADGVGLSSVSAPRVQAYQLEQAQVRPGQRVLEVGSGGVNAAYLAELAGPDGLVATIDIDGDVTARARQFLADTGYDQVQVITADAAFGVAQFAPFDLILVTVEITDIPQAWWDQLSDTGRIVAPIRWRGQRRIVTLDRHGPDVMIADKIEQAGFVAMQGASAHRELSGVLHDAPDQRVSLRLDDGMQVDAAALSRSLAEKSICRWTDVMLPQAGRFELVDLWLATVLDVAVLTGDLGAHEAGLIPKPSPIGIGWPTLVQGESMAYRIVRDTGAEQEQEIGIVAHGPAGPELTERYATALGAWDPQTHPRLTVTRQTPPTPPDGIHRSVRRPTSTFTISWPPHR